MLDEFSSATISASGPGRPAPSKTTAPLTQPTTEKSSAAATVPEDELGSDFSAKLQQEMAALLGEIDESPEMRNQLNELMGELTAGAERVLQEEDEKEEVAASSSKPDTSTKSAPSKASAPSPTGGATPDVPFTDTIRRTMERMAASGEQANAAAAAGSNNEDDMFAALLKEMASTGGEGSEEEFSKMLMGMMEQLTNKDILYEPMKELDDKFPAWMKDNEGKVPEADMARYKLQRDLVKEIMGRFERTGYSDENAQDREFIVERMQKVSPAAGWLRGFTGMVCLQSVDASGWKPSARPRWKYEGRRRHIRSPRQRLSTAITCFKVVHPVHCACDCF